MSEADNEAFSLSVQVHGLLRSFAAVIPMVCS